jgi:dihydrofolate reductase
MELILTAFVTMDGVMQGPGAADEDPSDGFAHGGWLVPFADPDMGTTVSAWIERADEILLGRRTYELMFPYWSRVTDPDDVVARQLNSLPKHVVSRSLGSADWEHSAVIGGDVVEAVRALKDKPGGELQVHGSAQLVQTRTTSSTSTACWCSPWCSAPASGSSGTAPCQPPSRRTTAEPPAPEPSC